MLLERLVDYSRRLVLPPTLYSYSPVRYIIELDAAGNLLNPRPTDTADPGSRTTRRGQPRMVPDIQRSSGVRALLLADKADYVLGYVPPDGKAGRVAACHAAFFDLVRRCVDETGELSVTAVLRFLTAGPLGRLSLGADFDPGAKITFRVDGMFPVDLPSVQAFWAADNDPSLKAAPVMQCLVCGQDRPVLERLQGKIKGVPGGQTSGTSIISANAEAFESYGLDASLIAPTCSECGERFTKGLNDLLDREEHRFRLGGAAFVWWTKEEVGFDFLNYLTNPAEADVGALLESVFRGRPTAIDETRFYGAVLSGSGGRAVVRDWLDTTVGNVKEQLARWHRAQEVVDTSGGPHRPLGIQALAGATVRELRDVAPPVMRSLLHTAFSGAPLPPDLLFQAVRRCRAEQGVNRQHAALIKMVLAQSGTQEEERSMVQLNTDHPSTAYHCGRLLAVLEEAQRAALPGVKATIVDRFYGTASSAPASVFSRLLRGVQPHLSKLERDRPGAFYALQGRLEEIQGRIAEFPRVLTLEDQGRFALGYYHQRAYDRAQAREAAERRRAGLPSVPGDDTAVDLDDQDQE
jgi:CRISPR-associated protein Csd1